MSQPVALKKLTSLTPGVHSLPENVLNDQQMNMPHFSAFSSSARRAMSTGSAAARHGAAANARTVANITMRVAFIRLPAFPWV